MKFSGHVVCVLSVYVWLFPRRAAGARGALLPRARTQPRSHHRGAHTAPPGSWLSVPTEAMPSDWLHPLCRVVWRIPVPMVLQQVEGGLRACTASRELETRRAGRQGRYTELTSNCIDKHMPDSGGTPRLHALGTPGSARVRSRRLRQRDSAAQEEGQAMLVHRVHSTLSTKLC